MQDRSELISLRVPGSLLARIKKAAAKQGIPYQTLIKQWLTEKVTQESKPAALPPTTVFVYLPNRRILGRPATQMVDTPPGTPEFRRPER